MIDIYSIIAMVFTGVSGLIMCLRSLKKCKYSKSGIEFEKETENELQRQQEFTLSLVRILHNVPPKGMQRSHSDDAMSSKQHPPRPNHVIIEMPEQHMTTDMNNNIHRLIMSQSQKKLTTKEKTVTKSVLNSIDKHGNLEYNQTDIKNLIIAARTQSNLHLQD